MDNLQFAENFLKRNQCLSKGLRVYKTTYRQQCVAQMWWVLPMISLEAQRKVWAHFQHSVD